MKLFLKTVEEADIFIKCLESTNEFMSMSADGFIRTYFKPNPAIHKYPTNLDYYNAQ